MPLVTILAVALFALTLVLAACGGTDTEVTSSSNPPTSSPQTTVSEGAASPDSSTTSIPGAPVVAAGSYAEKPDYLETQRVDLAAIANLAQAGLTEAEKQVLARQSFVAVNDHPDEGPWRFWQVYESARYQGLPLLVTTDSILNAYHGLFDILLQRMEEGSLFTQAEAMSQALYNAASAQWNAATDSAIKEDARLNMAYFAVANSLLSDGIAAPDVVFDEVEAELELIEAAAGPAESPLLAYNEDYSQYKPRGHYTRSNVLERYFKAMMWYGHTSFFINPREGDITEEEALSLTRRAILIGASLTDSAKEAWLALYEPTSFLVGRSDDITIDQLQLILTDVFGTAAPEPDDLADTDKVTAVREALNDLPAPKILSASVREEGDTTGREENERGLRVMGQRYIPDSYAFQQLVWPYVGKEPDNKRDLPMGLDVMTVLGSDQAYRIAKEDYKQDTFENWETQLAKINREFVDRTDGVWPANLYTGWLESLQDIMRMPDDRSPAFMRTREWARKSLNTALGSWTELRHDTILYAKQSVTAEGDGGEEPESQGYVEPYPAFYARIAELAASLRQSLTHYGLGDPEINSKLETMVGLAQTLAAIAEKELAGEELALEEVATIQAYGHYLEMLEQFSDDEEGRTLQPAAEKSALVADVHTSTNTHTALEEATGYPLTLYVALEIDGHLTLLAGAAYSYYEFSVPLADRMTDEEWIAVLDSGQAPARPGWTQAWIVER
jgi:hypothetical protein